jgi:hypothetical protein
MINMDFDIHPYNNINNSLNQVYRSQTS